MKDLLKLARLDETQAGADPTGIPLQLAPTDPRTLAVDALHDVRALGPTRPVTLTGPDDGTPASAAALADEAALRQVVSNLVGNSIAHAPAGSPIRIGVGTSDGHAVLEVADQGRGLSIVQSLVSAHRGRVELRTAPGQRAVFRVLLPRAADMASRAQRVPRLTGLGAVEVEACWPARLAGG